MTNRPTFTLDGARKNGEGIGNCVVLALTAATGLPYDKVEKVMTKQGCYQQGRGTRTNLQNMNQVGRVLGFKVTEAILAGRSMPTETKDEYKFICKLQAANDHTRNEPKTFGTLAKTKRGNWVACNSGHGVAILNGELIDNGWHIPNTPQYKRKCRWNRHLNRAYKIEMLNEAPQEFKTNNTSTSNPGTQLNIFS